MFKSMKPPLFYGEEQDHNKDVMNTFLQKWRDLHQLRHTPKEFMVIEASLSPEGKAYKWWMSLK